MALQSYMILTKFVFFKHLLYILYMLFFYRGQRQFEPSALINYLSRLYILFFSNDVQSCFVLFVGSTGYDVVEN